MIGTTFTDGEHYTVEVTARKEYLTDGGAPPGTYGWVYDTDVWMGVSERHGHMRSTGLFEDTTVRLIQTLTGLDLRDLREKLSIARNQEVLA